MCIRDSVKGESKPYTVTAGDSLALVIPGNASIVTRLNQPATVLWSSNAALMAPGKEFNYRIDLYEGNYADEAALSASQPVATYTVGKDKNSVRIEENVLSKLSNGNTPAYTVLYFIECRQMVRRIGKPFSPRVRSKCDQFLLQVDERLSLIHI